MRPPKGYQLSFTIIILTCLCASLLISQASTTDRPILSRPNENQCQEEEFPCGNTSVCIDRRLQCDDVPHCEKGEDEENCRDRYGMNPTKLMGHSNERLPVGEPPDSFYNCSLVELPESCLCRKNYIYCEDPSLTAIPPDLPPDMTKVVLLHTSITELPPDAFKLYPRLRVISLSHAKLRVIWPGAFRGISNTTFLVLRHNLLEGLPRGIFDDTPNLYWISVMNNSIKSFDPSLLSGLDYLNTLDAENNLISFPSGTRFPLLWNLTLLSLSYNKIEFVENETFSSLLALSSLNLSHNEIREIQEDAFYRLDNLEELDLSYNKLTHLPARLFYSLYKLQKLFLGRNQFVTLHVDIFRQLGSLRSLGLDEIELSNIDIGHFHALVKLEFVYFKWFHYCSYAPYVRLCYPKTDGLSSTEHLLVWPVLRLSVWVVALSCCLGNSVVLSWRLLSRKEDRVLSLFIKNLSVADFLMGLYLLAIGIQDVAFRDTYNVHARTWMSSWRCTVCGCVAMLSCETSVLILSLITFERYRCIRTNVRALTERTARYGLVVVWSIGVLLAALPVLRWDQSSFYSSNGLCFPLHIHDPYMVGWQYSAFVFLGVNLFAVLLIISLYLRMFVTIKSDRRRARPVLLKQREDAVLALRFFFIVVTDCLCWIPIIIIKIFALSHIPIPENLYALVVVFILPVNSALNPVIYTLAAPTELRRRIQGALRGALVCRSRFSFASSDSKTPTSSLTTQSSCVSDGRTGSNGTVVFPAVRLCGDTTEESGDETRL